MKVNDDDLELFREHILKNTTDGGEGFDEYLASLHVNIISDNAICLYAILDEHIALYYMESFNRSGYRECRDTINFLFEAYTIKQDMPVYYIGDKNVVKNNSVDIGGGVYQFVPKGYQGCNF